MRSEEPPFRAALAAHAFAVALAGCVTRTAYVCDPTHRCSGSAVCLPEGHCAAVDRTCPSGFRYTASGPAPNACADPQDASVNDAPALDAAEASSDVPAPFDAPDALDAPDAPPPACALAAPQLVSPLSTYRVSSQRPTVRYLASPALRAVKLEFARTRDFSAVAYRVSTPVAVPDGGTGPLVPQGAIVPPEGSSERLSPGAWFWRARGVCADGTSTAYSSTWQFRVLRDLLVNGPGVRASASDAALPGGIDLNGDGFDDLLVGAPGRRSVFVYYGSRDARAMARSPVELRPNNLSGTDSFGALIANAGDVNGDGFGDVLVGSCARRGTDSAACPPTFALVYGDPDTGAAARPRMSAITVPEVTLSARVAVGLDGVGDVNSDGYADLVVGNDPMAFAGARAGALLLFGGPGGPGTVFTLLTDPANTSDPFQPSVAGTGPFDETGVPAVHLSTFERVLRPTGYDPAAMRAAGYSVTTSAPTFPNYGANGALLAPAGDMDGDGLGDLLVGNEASAFGMQVRIVACFGSATPAPACTTLVSEIDNAIGTDERRLSLGGGGDVNGDGLDDVFVSNRRVDGAQTDLWIAPGNATRTGSALNRTACRRTTDTPAGYGAAVTILGDFDGDGFDDMAISSVGPAGTSTAVVDRVELVFGAGGDLGSLCERPVALPLPAGLAAGNRFGFALR